MNLSQHIRPAIVAVLISGAVGGLSAQTREDTPLALLDQARSKDAIRTARIEWVYQELDRRQPDKGIMRSRFYTWRAAPNRHASIHHGDEEGVLFRDAEGNPEGMSHTFSGSASCLEDTDGAWIHREGSPAVDLMDPAPMRDIYGLQDLRHLGTEPLLEWQAFEQRLAENGMTPLQYSTFLDGDLVVVRADSKPIVQDGRPVSPDAKAGSISWWLDPARGFNPVRVTCYMQDQMIFDHQISLANYDGLWYPQSVETYALSESSERILLRQSEVLSAEFNRPEHPQTLGPADIGVEPGMTIMDKRSGTGRGPRVWDGEKMISPEEYRERRTAGELNPGPTVLRHEARFNALHARRRAERAAERPAAESQPATQPSVAPVPTWAEAERQARDFSGDSWRRVDTLWEAYTRAFIARFRLDDEQAQLAWRICRECQDEARAHIERIRSELERAERTLADFPGQPGPADEPRRKKAQAELARLVQPLDEIFTRRLQPRLEKLPTRAQRLAAEPPLER